MRTWRRTFATSRSCSSSTLWYEKSICKRWNHQLVDINRQATFTRYVAGQALNLVSGGRTKTPAAMKGKGKGKDVPTKGKNSKDNKDNNDKDGTDLKDCPLQFPDFTPIDHTRTCPRYTAILQRTDEEIIGVEELDALQFELETLLTAVSKRMRLLHGEMQILIDWQDKKEIKKPVTGKMHLQASGKRSKTQEEKPVKKFKDNGKGSHNTPGGPGRPKSKNLQAKMQEYEFTDSPVDAPRLPKNDAPNRFWASVEPYCTEIMQEDLKFLEDLIKMHEEDSEYYKVPGLGKHYSIKWAQEDMLEEQKEGSKIGDKRRGLSNSSSLNSCEAEKLLKKAEKECDDTSPFGTLTQRLVSCLIEENIMTSLDDSIVDSTSTKDGLDGNTSSSVGKGFMKSLNITNASQLERRIKRELEEQGILDVEEPLPENPDDEILAELRRCQAELRVVTSQNLQAKRRMFKLAKEEIQQQELRKKLQVIDNEVMEAYRKIQSSRQKKKTPTKKEKEQAWKLLRERDSLIKSLEG